MASNVLALKYRPRFFADIVGNAFTTRILRNSLTTGNIKHAYFLAGGKGSGKTSTARIFAKALNCTARQEQNPEPCGKCVSCVEVDNDVLMGDVQEIDAASQNSVASIRALITQVQYPPVSGKWRIIILDECHMLTGAAANTLLKTLEEPPAHAIFIFCTTDPQKVLDTIRSRALYFEFSRLTVGDIADRLMFVAKEEGFVLQEEAAELIAQGVNGALRDAITILDQASILDTTITAETVEQIIGHVSVLSLYDLFEKIYASDFASVLKWLDEMVDKLDQDILVSVLHFIESLVLLNLGVDVSRRIPKDLADKVKKLSTAFSVHQLYSMAELVRESLGDYRKLALRDSRVLLRLLFVGLVFAKEENLKTLKSERPSIYQLVQNGRQIPLEFAAKLRAILNAEEVDIQPPS